MAAARRLGSRGAIALAIQIIGIVLAAILSLQNLGDAPPRNSPPVRAEGDMRFTLPSANDGTPLMRTDYAQEDDAFPILVVDTVGQGRQSFRVAGRCLWAVENNLSLANMD